MSSLAQETLMGSSSVETEIIAATAAVDIAIDEGQQRDDDLYDYNRELERERHERRIARLALRDQISENGFACAKRSRINPSRDIFLPHCKWKKCL